MAGTIEPAGGFQPASRAGVGPPVGGPGTQASQAAQDNVALLQRIWGPAERGESDDPQPFFDHLAEDVVLTFTFGELRGKQAVIDYFAKAAELVEFWPFQRPLEYFRNGERVVAVGEEAFRIKRSGVTLRRDWAWVMDFRDGLITRILGIEDLSGLEEEIGAAAAAARGQRGQTAAR